MVFNRKMLGFIQKKTKSTIISTYLEPIEESNCLKSVWKYLRSALSMSYILSLHLFQINLATDITNWLCPLLSCKSDSSVSYCSKFVFTFHGRFFSSVYLRFYLVLLAIQILLYLILINNTILSFLECLFRIHLAYGY